MMRGAVQLVVLTLFAQTAIAEDVAMPSCTNTDGSTSTLYDVQGARFVNGVNSFLSGNWTTRFLDCGSGVGYEIKNVGGMIIYLDVNGNVATYRSPPDVIRTEMRDEAFHTMADIMHNFEGGGFQTRLFDPITDCLCSNEMRHAMERPAR